MSNDYKRKIKTKEELLDIIGERPFPSGRIGQQMKTIMCHGTFDLVHPGHIRHLMYAKSKADILIVSLTGDAFIDKANYRPFVPAELRAMNLAALEVVDYVLTDDSPVPIENILYLKPDYFAKGFEYLNSNNIKIQEEREAVQSYNGEIIFTPGDLTYSSSEIIEQSPPNLSHEKLGTLMDAHHITWNELEDALDSFHNIKVHVLGDTIIDTYIYCNTISSGMSKTPTISVSQQYKRDFIGGAAIVAKHIKHAGGDVTFSTVLGIGKLSQLVRENLLQDDITLLANVDSSRPTTQKSVYIADKHRLLKVDKLDNHPISKNIIQSLKQILEYKDFNACVFSDFRHGIFNQETIPEFINSISKDTFKVVDSQVASRWGNILDFKMFDLITPNEREARFALADQDSVIRPLALELYKQAQCKTLIMKLGNKGILTYCAPSNSSGSFFSIDSFCENLVDPIGAGDALLAYSTLGMVATNSPVISSILGSFAAGVACEIEGNNPVTPEAVINKLERVENSL